MQFIPTNDVFHHLVNFLQLDSDATVELFNTQNVVVTKSKIKAWKIKTGGQKKGYREMPRDMLDVFIDGVYDAAKIQARF